eukprot:Gregarina_sp_Poly_1__7170@NODE_392_length_8959_cov_63_078835_g321_i0_p8_GENE_NODE_392_length_8959_cov_63_078835_g321_i0NODE_392_length_8959_cov_63_078835_g321_i0_p8_ORF_typecomplete_len141_score18_76Pterin_bind/PF00809_22/1_8e17ERKJNK_inhib/PF15002_6/0_99ERKJNK_inhib/PF15002_6/1_4e02_NODE_392_length_8959_cov_63_078835_g321_i026653087
MYEFAEYSNLLGEISLELTETINKCLKAGIYRWRILCDPGIGFSKKGRTNFQLLEGLNKLQSLLPRGMFFVLGMSRKRFLRKINPSKGFDYDEAWDDSLQLPTEELDFRSIALIENHQLFRSVCCLRVHDPVVYSRWLTS